MVSCMQKSARVLISTITYFSIAAARNKNCSDVFEKELIIYHLIVLIKYCLTTLFSSPSDLHVKSYMEIGSETTVIDVIKIGSLGQY